MRTCAIAAALLLAAAGMGLAQTTASAPAPASAPADPDKPITVEQLVLNTNYVSYYQGADGKASVRMTIHDDQDRKRTREFVILRWDQPRPKPEGQDPVAQPDPNDKHTGEQKFYVYFQRPSDVDRTAFLIWKHLKTDDDRWLYQPGLDLLNRISAADKRTSFVGSHFYYEDVSGRNLDLDTHEILWPESNAGKKLYYVMKNTPKDPSKVEFAYYKMWIHRKAFLPVQISYYDDKGKENRRYRALAVKTIQGYPTVVKSEMRDLSNGGHTVLEYDQVRYNMGIPENVFDQRYLRRPPLEYLKSDE